MNQVAESVSLGRRFAALVVGIGLAVAASANGWAQAPTPEQVELLQSLPPEERQILIDEANKSLTGTVPLVTVGEDAKQNDGAQNGRPHVAGRPMRDKDGDGIEDVPEPLKSAAELKPFGYDIFRRTDADFEPEAAIPVPNDYVIGPGDRIEVQLFGNERGNYLLIVGRDGQVRFPKLGPVPVGGMRFEDVRELITERISRQFVGTDVSISMGELRSIRVFALGDVERPGSYLVSALSTISNVLLTAGGISTVGSLRDVQLKRSGRIIARLDLYDLLLNGDTSNDLRLLPGDVVFVPPIGATASVFGQFNRPAIYEIKSGTTVDYLLFLSGGLKPNADPRYAQLERIVDGRERVTVDLDLTLADDRERKLRTGDLLTVVAIRPTLYGSVELTGALLRPKAFQYSDGAHLTDVIPALDDLANDADPEYVLIRREAELGRTEYLSANLRKALRQPRGVDDVELQARDRVIVLRLADNRQEVLNAAIAELRTQGQLDFPARVVSVGGRVRAPGEYPLEQAMTVSDLLRAGGGAQDAAYGATAELTRYKVESGERRDTEVITVDLAAVLQGDSAADMALRPYDVLTIKQTPQWEDAEFIEVSGEVTFPGTYPIRRGETLKTLLVRVGGLTQEAFPTGAVFARQSLQNNERQQLDRLASRLQSDLTLLALRSAQSAQKSDNSQDALAIGRTLLADLRDAKPVGRLVIDLEGIQSGKSPDVELRGGDTLVVPRKTESVTVIGEVQNPTSHLWRAEVHRNGYLGFSGGLTAKADKKRIYVVRADGSVAASIGGAWFNDRTAQVGPGDTIVVPFDAERMPRLPLWASVTQIIYNLAIAAAAVNSF